MKDPERQKKGKKSYKTYTKKLKDRFLKYNQVVPTIYRSFLERLKSSIYILVAIEEAICIMREEHKTEISVSTGMI